MLPPAQTLVGWLSGSTALVASGGNVRRMRAVSLAGGPSRVLADDAEQLFEPSWSPDGSLMITIARTTPHAELRLQHADGSGARTVSLPEQYAFGATWSPDQKRIVYVGLSDTQNSHVSIVELASGRAEPLFDLRADENVSLRWLPDSHTLILTETIGRPDTGRRVAFRKLEPGGATSVLREITLGPLPGGGMSVDDTTAVVRQNAQDGYHALRLNGDGPDRDILPPPARDASAASLSADARWLIFRHGPAPGESGSVVELYRVDGTDHKTISVPFQVGPNPKMIPGGTDLIALESARATGESGVYLVSGAQPPRQLFTYSSQNLPPDVAISPDGRTLLYLLVETVPPSIRTMDVSARGK
jgi:Tol biopolymer transport system component